MIDTYLAKEVQKALKEKLELRQQARTSFIAYLRLVWWMPHKFLTGRHTIKMCEAVDKAIDKYFRGEASFLLIEVPFRHGKSDIFSRALPGYFLARTHDRGLDPDIIMTSYGTDLSEGFSVDSKNIIKSPSYSNTFDIKVACGANNKGEWRIENSYGKVVATGLGGGLTGKGYGLGICDDYFKNREEAESVGMRDKIWKRLSDDFMTRRAPVSITIIVATPWHVDGPGGRILKKMAEDPLFPRFEHIRMPARTKKEDGAWEYLFPERYSEEWYTGNYATLGPYSSAGLLDCNPQPAAGNACKAEWFEVVDAIPASFDAEIRWWDLAATAKKNADYTTGTYMGMKDGVFYMTDQHRSQTEAGSILNLVYHYATRDGVDITIGIEQEGGSAGKILSSAFAKKLCGYSMLFKHPTGDKLTRALPFFAQAAAGNVKLLRGPWNKAFLEEVAQAPDGAHDDTWDSAAGAFAAISRSRSI